MTPAQVKEMRAELLELAEKLDGPGLAKLTERAAILLERQPPRGNAKVFNFERRAP